MAKKTAHSTKRRHPHVERHAIQLFEYYVAKDGHMREAVLIGDLSLTQNEKQSREAVNDLLERGIFQLNDGFITAG